ncbi:MAG: hypothetical protein LBL55_10060, partial [Propionibacteriaceae bacterium]|nr:hypothetical protein [Propionibacteriaceae bacterium]
MMKVESVERTAAPNPDHPRSERAERSDGHRVELGLALAAGAAYAAGLVLEHLIAGAGAWSAAAYLVACLCGGWLTAREAWGSLKRGRFEVDSLMLLAAVGAVAVGRLAEGAVLLFLFSLGHALEEVALARASRSIEALGQLAPRTAWV